MKTLRELAKDALQIQDACNLSGVAGGLQRHVVALREIATARGKDWAWVDRHPTTVLWVDKLASLTGYQQALIYSEYGMVGAIADGQTDGP